ncbi:MULTISPECIES: hypothetical protein [Clostridium]|jgi:hypothetical protein|uniref:Uncharacterized protein n=1 Tax=Clostridium lapidicellarium TaxID=3240931 RepID=A0ABV4E142_9CLOT|nr:hypothetical protein [uncultured Clostridium sp.]NLU07746.1 hypothetical protein [Clostridiales bacterium]
MGNDSAELLEETDGQMLYKSGISTEGCGKNYSSQCGIYTEEAFRENTW